jgi:hypothetical protein
MAADMETKHPNLSVLAIVCSDFQLHFLGRNSFVAQGASFAGPFPAP